ncbi:MAG: MEDS domain-containing protein [Actinomycetota bacterium]
MSLIPELRQTKPGEHLCHLFSAEEERVEVARAYVSEGLKRGQKVLIVSDGGKGDEILHLLVDPDQDLGGFLEREQLQVYDASRFYMPKGDFEVSTALSAWEEETRRCAEEGWNALRVLMDMSWALSEPPGWESLARYEAEINRLPGADHCLFLCQYDRRRFQPSFQLDLLRTHPRVIVDLELLDNVFYLPPGEFLNNMVPESVLEHHLLHLAERKRAVLEIEEARLFSQAVVDTIREPLLVLDADLQVLAANQSFYRTFQVSPEETEGRTVYSIGNRQWDIPALRKLLEEVIPLNSSLRDYLVDHDFPRLGRRTMRLNARRIHGEGNRPPLILLAIEDVSEKEAALELLRRRERYFHRLVENSFDAVTVLDAQGRHLYASPSTERVLGWKPEELLGKTPFEFMHPDDLPEVMRVFEEGLGKSGTVVAITHRWRDAEGNWRTIESSGSNLLEDPYVRGVVINCRDVTLRRLAEERVHRLNRMFLSLGADFLANMETVILACREILEGEVAAYARPEGEKMTLLTTLPGEESLILLEESRSFAGHPLLAERPSGPLVLGSEGEAALPEGDPLVRAHGYRLFVGQPVVLDGGVIGVLSVYYRDRRSFTREDLETLAILARALAIEEERLAREQVLKDFIDLASHELRHPITIIKGYSLTLKERLKDSGKREEVDMLSAIDEGSNRLVRLVESLLDVSRIERGQLELDLREADALPLLRRAVKEVRSLGHAVTLRAGEGPGSCLLDPDRFLEVVSILLDNATKFSPPGSEVEVKVERGEGHLLFSVLDRGPGIPEEERTLVFNRFYQVEKPRFHSKPGMGMGLYIAREIVERHGGRIWYEPREGGGSVFRFTIPLAGDR